MDHLPGVSADSIELSLLRQPYDEDHRTTVSWIVDELQRKHGDTVVCQWGELMNSSFGAKMESHSAWTFVISDHLLDEIPRFLSALSFYQAVPDDDFTERSVRFYLDVMKRAQIAFFPSSFVGFRPEELERRAYTVRDTLRREVVPNPAAAFASYLRLVHRFPRTYAPDPGPFPSPVSSWRRTQTPRRTGRHVLNSLVQGLLDADPFNVPTPPPPSADEEGKTFVDQRALIVAEEWEWREDEGWMREVMFELLTGRYSIQDLELAAPATASDSVDPPSK